MNSSTGGGWAAGLTVWAKWINAQGGILGHPVTLLEKDTKSDPVAGLTAVKSLLSDSKVVALIPGASAGATLAPAITAAKAPVVGGLGDDQLWFTNPYVFPVTTTVDASTAILAKLGASGGSKNGAVLYCAEAPACAEVVPAFNAAAAAIGGKLVYEASISSSASSYTAQCLAAQNAKAGYMWAVVADAVLPRVADGCAANNYKPLYVLPTESSPSFAQVPALNGAKIEFGDAAYSSPAASAFRAAVAKYDPSLEKQPYWNEYVFQAWNSGQELAEAIKLAKPTGTVTRADVFDGLYQFDNQTLSGATPPLTFHRGKPASVPCAYTGQIQDGKVIGNSTPVCAG